MMIDCLTQEVESGCSGGLSEARRPGSGGYFYYWSGSSDGARLGVVAIVIFSRLLSSVVGVTPVDELIILLRLKHTLGSMSLVAVYAPTETSELEGKEMF